MQKVHEAGLAHCDIKPENVMLMDDLAIKLCDFGAAVAIHPNTGRVAAMPTEIINMEQQFAWPEAAKSAQLESFGVSNSPASQTLLDNALPAASRSPAGNSADQSSLPAQDMRREQAAQGPGSTAGMQDARESTMAGVRLGGDLVLQLANSREGASELRSTGSESIASSQLPSLRAPRGAAQRSSFVRAMQGGAQSASATCTERAASMASLTPYSLRKVSQVRHTLHHAALVCTGVMPQPSDLGGAGHCFVQGGGGMAF